MQRSHSIADTHPRATHFTLIEMLVVLAIAGVLMGVAVTAVNYSPGMNSAGRMVMREVYLSRQYAIAKRKYVALLVPDKDLQSSDVASLPRFKNCAIRPVIVTKDSSGKYVFDSLITGADWQYLPAGVQVASLTYPTMCSQTSADSFKFLGVGGNYYNVRAIVFQPNGSLVDPVNPVQIDLGAVVKGASVPTDTAHPTSARLTVNGLTGRVVYETRHH